MPVGRWLRLSAESARTDSVKDNYVNTYIHTYMYVCINLRWEIYITSVCRKRTEQE